MTNVRVGCACGVPVRTGPGAPLPHTTTVHTHTRFARCVEVVTGAAGPGVGRGGWRRRGHCFDCILLYLDISVISRYIRTGYIVTYLVHRS